MNRQHFLLAFTTVWVSQASIDPLRAAYTFINIADSSGAFLDFNSPAINADGTVTFRASLDGGGGGVYRYDANGLDTIAETGDVFQGVQFQTPGIDAEGNVSFVALRRGEAGGGLGIFIGDGAETDIYALTPTTTSPVPGDFAGFTSTVMNAEGTPAYIAAFVGQPPQGIRGGLYIGGTRVADDLGDFNSFADSLGRGLDVNNNNVVVFKAHNDDNSAGIYVAGGGGGVVPVAETTDGFTGFNFSVPAINDAGEIVFWAEPTPFVSALYTATLGGGDPEVFVDVNGLYSDFGVAPSINEFGQIAFTARIDNIAQGNGIFTGPDANEDKVIVASDPLFDSTFGTAFISNASLNDAGQVAFAYSLADGRMGIALATPIPTSYTADYDLDGDVDGRDFLVWQRGGSPNPLSAEDLALWHEQYGAPSLAATQAVPEPGSGFLLMMSATLIRACYRSRLPCSNK